MQLKLVVAIDLKSIHCALQTLHSPASALLLYSLLIINYLTNDVMWVGVDI